MNRFRDITEVVAIDCETTGLSPRLDRIVSIAAIRFDVSKLAFGQPQKTECMVCLINPGCPIPPVVSRIHGITDERVRNEQSFGEIAVSIRNFLGALPIVAHNIAFDSEFLNNEFRRAGCIDIERNQKLFTMAAAARSLNLRRNTLDYVAAHFGFKRNSEFHDALEDARLVSQIATEFHLKMRGASG